MISAGFKPFVALEAEARELFHRGAARRYVRRTSELASPRGRLEVGLLACGRSPAAVTLPCTHYPRSSDFLLNRVVRAGLGLGRQLAGAKSLKRALAQTEALYGELAQPLVLSRDSLRAAERSIDRLTASYTPVIRLIELLHASTELAFDDGSLRVRGFLFDMNRFFQTLLSRFLRECLPACRVQDEYTLGHMLAYAPGANPRRRRPPRPRPDFVVTRGREGARGDEGGRGRDGVRAHAGVRAGPDRALLGAKYRDLWNRDLPRDMLYQLAIYALSQPPGAAAAILYPTEDPAATEAIIDIRDPMSDAVRAHVALRPVVVPQLLELLNGSGQVATRERRRFAEGLVFGVGQG